MKKIITYIFLIFYLCSVFFVTFYILTFNKYNVSQFGNKVTFVAQEETPFPYGSLVIAEKTKNVQIEDQILYYDTYTSKGKIKAQTVKEIQILNKIESLYTLEDGHLLSNNHIVGLVENTTVIPHLGTILDIVSSQLGYLLLFVLPILFFLIYLVHSLREEIKNDRK